MHEIGLDGVVPKPVEPRRLLAALEEAMEADAPDPEARTVVTRLAAHPRFTADNTEENEDHEAPPRRFWRHGR
jgi:DNA-binding response OmpR family regulator